MRKLFIIAACAVFVTSCKKNDVADNGVQTVYENGFHTLPGSVAFGGNISVKTSDNNLVLCGMTSGQAQVVKLDGEGSILWQKVFFVEPGAEVTSLVEVPGTGFALAGGNHNSSFVVSMNATGQRRWKNYYGNSNTIARHLATTSNGEIILAGTAYTDTARSNGKPYLARIKSDGGLTWEKNFERTVSCNDVDISGSNEILLTGAVTSTGFAQGIYLLKVAESGDQLLERTPPATETTVGICSQLLPDGEVITLAAGNAGGYSALMVSKFDGTGKKLWEQEISESGMHLQASALHMNADGSMIVAGSIQDGASVASADILAVKLDPSGNRLWLKKIGGGNEDRACSIVSDNAGLILVGNTKSYGEKKGEPNIFLLRINDAGDVIY